MPLERKFEHEKRQTHELEKEVVTVPPPTRAPATAGARAPQPAAAEPEEMNSISWMRLGFGLLLWFGVIAGVYLWTDWL